MKVVYVAGPFRAKTQWGIIQNVRKAEEVALEVARAGAMPLCPHTNTRYFHGLLTEEFWLEGTLELLRRCDAIVMVGGWQYSSGSKVELAEAKELGLPVFMGTNNLKQWVETGRL